MTEQNLVEEDLTYCAVHPDRETGLRCNKCGRYMCAQCAVQTPVGYRCRECVRQVEDKFYKGTDQDYVVMAAVTAGLGLIAGAIMSAVGYLLAAIILGLPTGGIIAEAAMRATQRRRGRRSGEVAAGGFVAGAIFGAGVRLALVYQDRYGEVVQVYERAGRSLPPQIPDQMDFILSNLASFGFLAFLILAAAAVYSRVKM